MCFCKCLLKKTPYLACFVYKKILFKIIYNEINISHKIKRESVSSFQTPKLKYHTAMVTKKSTVKTATEEIMVLFF